MCASLKIVNLPAGSKRARLGWAGLDQAGPGLAKQMMNGPGQKFNGPGQKYFVVLVYRCH